MRAFRLAGVLAACAALAAAVADESLSELSSLGNSELAGTASHSSPASGNRGGPITEQPVSLLSAFIPPAQAMPARLPNGMTMNVPGNIFAAELPYAAGLARGDPQTFASAAASLSTNPQLAAAVRQQASLKLQLGRRITSLEMLSASKQQTVNSAAFELRKAENALLLAQRDAFVARSQLASAHKQLAALDVNARRLADSARLVDLKKALALTEATIKPGSVLTETQRVVNSQLAASLRDQVSATEARIAEATKQIDAILSGKDSKQAAADYKEAEAAQEAGRKSLQKALDMRTKAEKANIVRAHAMADKAHDAITKAGDEAAKAKPVEDKNGGKHESGKDKKEHH